ncbi:MAG: hypothetical protein ABI599_01760 [Flavobacteriales bacterium]
MKLTILPILLTLATGCKNDPGTNPGSNQEGPGGLTGEKVPDAGKVTPSESNRAAEAPQLDPAASIGDTPDGVSLADLASSDAGVREAAARTISRKLANAKSNQWDAVSADLRNYAVTHTREFIGLFKASGGHEILSTAEFAAWARIVRGPAPSKTPDVAGRAAINRMTQACTDCGPEERKLLDMFASMVTGDVAKIPVGKGR